MKELLDFDDEDGSCSNPTIKVHSTLDLLLDLESSICLDEKLKYGELRSKNTDNYKKEDELLLNFEEDSVNHIDDNNKSDCLFSSYKELPQDYFNPAGSSIEIDAHSSTSRANVCSCPKGPQAPAQYIKPERLAAFNSFKNRSQSLINAGMRTFSFHEESKNSKDLIVKLDSKLQEKLLSLEDLAVKPQITSFSKKKEQVTEMFQKAYSLCDLRNVKMKEKLSNRFEHASLDGLFCNQTEPNLYQLSFEACSSCTSCRSNSSSYHSLLYDQEIASNYQIYQPTVCDVKPEDDLSLPQDHLEPTSSDCQTIPREYNDNSTAINKKEHENLAAKHFKQGQMVLGNIRGKLSKVSFSKLKSII